MSKVAHAYADDKPGGDLPRDAPGGQVNDPSHKTKGTGTEAVPVIDDDAPVEDPVRPEEADSDRQLAKDEAEAKKKKQDKVPFTAQTIRGCKVKDLERVLGWVRAEIAKRKAEMR